MITIYNESNTPWSLEAINETCSRLSSTIKYTNKEKAELRKTIGINVTGENVFGEELNLDKLIEMKEPVTISNKSTNTAFRKKDCRAYITTDTKFNKNLVFATIKLNGSTITDITAPVLEYYIACGYICMIVATNDAFTVSMHDAKNNIDTTYAFCTYEEDGAYNVTISESTPEETEYEMYAIKKYRPKKATYVIFSHVRDVNALKNIEKLNLDYYKVVTFANKDEFDSAVESVINEKYSAVTLFANTTEATGDNFKIYKNNYNTLRSKFRVFNLLLSDGKILKR